MAKANGYWRHYPFVAEGRSCAMDRGAIAEASLALCAGRYLHLGREEDPEMDDGKSAREKLANHFRQYRYVEVKKGIRTAANVRHEARRKAHDPRGRKRFDQERFRATIEETPRVSALDEATRDHDRNADR